MTATAKQKLRKTAPESQKTRRAREKLLKQWKRQKEKITPEALKKTIEKIHKWIADHAEGRYVLKRKNISLFNQNADVAIVSKKVELFSKKLQNG